MKNAKITTVHKLTCTGGGLRSRFFNFPLREAHFKNPNNKTVLGGVMQGLTLQQQSGPNLFLICISVYNIKYIYIFAE